MPYNWKIDFHNRSQERVMSENYQGREHLPVADVPIRSEVDLAYEQAIWDGVDRQFQFTCGTAAENYAPFFEAEPKRISELRKLAGGGILASFTLLQVFHGTPPLAGKIFLLCSWLFFLLALLYTIAADGSLTSVQLYRPRVWNRRRAIQNELAAIEDLNAREIRCRELIQQTIDNADAETKVAYDKYQAEVVYGYRSFLIAAGFFVLYAVTSLF